MSFLGGPECSTGANPLAQFQKQTSADTSLQRDRLTSRQPQHLNGFRSPVNRAPDAAFQDFAQQGPVMGEALPDGSFHMEQMRREYEHARHSGGATPNWAGEFAQQMPEEFAQQQQQQQHRNGAFSPQDFANFRQQSHLASSQRTASPSYAQQSAFARPPMYGGMPMGGFGMQQPMMYRPQMMGTPLPQEGAYVGKGKGRVQELSDTDWEKQFEELSTEDREADDEQLDREADMAIERELNEMDEKLAQEPWGLTVDGEEEAEAHEHIADQLDSWKDFDYTGLRSFDYSRYPSGGEYLFEENNVFKDQPNAFEEGQKIMREGGNLSLAALAFEAAVQRQSDFVEAWVALGQAQAQNEKEMPAVNALEHALKLDPGHPEALMGLAIAYTNEGYDSLTYRMLERWIAYKYPQLGIKPHGMDEGEAEEEIGFTERHILQERVTGHFLTAAQLNPSGGGVDVDVQVGLGVLFYGSEDYDKAVDCFTAALSSVEHGALKREGEEHLLWNRLGATLANSGRSEEAIDAYSRALELRPNFVRARYNLGVSCINLGVLDEAANHLLGALNMHRVIEAEGRQKAAELLRDGSGGDVLDENAAVDAALHHNQSTNLFDTLRRVFTQMGRRDLAERVGPDVDLDSFRGEFDF